jgi:hypothetical protein
MTPEQKIYVGQVIASCVQTLGIAEGVIREELPKMHAIYPPMAEAIDDLLIAAFRVTEASIELGRRAAKEWVGRN